MNAMFMLDTNAVSDFMHGRSKSLDREIARRGKPGLCVSAITYGETLYGLANRAEASHLARSADTLFQMVKILPWTADTAAKYGHLRARMRHIGVSLQPFDMLIAAHALEVGATLVTRARAFRHVPGLHVEDWTAA